MISAPAVVFGKRSYLILFVLMMCAQFNVTSFFKAGITVSFFEIALLLSSLPILLYSKSFLGSVRFTAADKVFFAFLIFSGLSVVIAVIRIGIGNLVPSFEYLDTNPILRSFMSLNKVILFVPLLIVLRNYLLTKWDSAFLNQKFLIYLAYSGILPAFAVLIQFLGVGFFLIHNNPSFGEDFKIVDYYVDRPVGLTNEASFFVYQLFFSFVALFECNFRGLIKKRLFIFIFILFAIAVVLSLSRTGLIFYIFFMLLYQFRSGLSLTKTIGVAVVLSVAFFLVRNLNIYGFNIIDRIMSSFDTQADLSTIERYGSTQAIWDLALDKALLVGVGIYNYGYYATSYLPEYMSVIQYSKDKPLPSFNFVLQLVAEWGIPLFLFFVTRQFFKLRKSNDYFVKIFFMFLLFYALTFQVLNFATPFLILLFTTNDEKDTLRA
ncbi:O-antigen ligase family protein [Sphingobacterium deserti]|nr:O-antigen ligase family protein [Sphingobacterium deserti]